MERRVSVRMLSEQRCPGMEAERSEVRTSGTLTPEEGGWRLHYDEDAAGAAHTSMLAGEERITLRRSGAVRAEMVFAEGERHTTIYELAFGSLPLDILTERLDVQLDGEGGTVDLRYRIEAQGRPVSDNRLLLEVACIEE